MSKIATRATIPAMNQESIGKVRQLYEVTKTMPQIPIDTYHVIHGGMYARSIMIPANSMITGALIRIATILIVQGDVVAYIGDKSIELHGYNVVSASAGRKQAFVALSDVYMTMIFPTDVKTVAEAEDQFTDEADLLVSRGCDRNQTVVTGE